MGSELHKSGRRTNPQPCRVTSNKDSQHHTAGGGASFIIPTMSTQTTEVEKRRHDTVWLESEKW